MTDHIHKPINSFRVDIDDDTIRREREKARALRKTRWWHNQLAKGLCHYCKQKFPPEALTLDHIVPLTRGGVSKRGNIVAACKSCNSRKKYLLPWEWEEYVQRVMHAEPGDT